MSRPFEKCNLSEKASDPVSGRVCIDLSDILHIYSTCANKHSQQHLIKYPNRGSCIYLANFTFMQLTHKKIETNFINLKQGCILLWKYIFSKLLKYCRKILDKCTKRCRIMLQRCFWFHKFRSRCFKMRQLSFWLYINQISLSNRDQTSSLSIIFHQAIWSKGKYQR